jgi:hypothetical protein
MHAKYAATQHNIYLENMAEAWLWLGNAPLASCGLISLPYPAAALESASRYRLGSISGIGSI